MKKLLVMVAFTSNLAFAHLDGGISGGGGNVINSTPPNSAQDPREVRLVIKGSTHLLLKYLYSQYSLYKAGSMSEDMQKLFSKFFETDDDEICEITKEIKINIPLDQGCFDGDRKEFDGSSFNPTEKSICISAYRISKNTTLREIPIQSAALMLHEYAEAYGLSDDEAVELQSKALIDLKNW